MKISTTRYLQGFCIIVLVLGIVRCAKPSVAEPNMALTTAAEGPSEDAESPSLPPQGEENLSTQPSTVNSELSTMNSSAPHLATRFFRPDGTEVKNRILSVASFAKAFPDSQDVQLQSARQWGVSPVQNRDEAELRKNELVYMGSNVYYDVDPLRSSIPYLVPRAAVLLQDIGQSFFDSLQTKGVPLHKIIVTSVTRSKDDVKKLQRHNGNATENSCHLYGTTFDICYNRYQTVQTQRQPRREVRNDSLKWILSEVLRDKRQDGRCYVKYERKQGCFHITVR